MAKNQNAGKSAAKSAPEAVKAKPFPQVAIDKEVKDLVADKLITLAGGKPAKAARQVPAGTVEGPKGGKLVDNKDTEKHEVPDEQRQGERRAQTTVQPPSAIEQFANGNMTTPAAHAPALTPEQLKKAEFDQKMADLAKEYGVSLPATAPTAKQKAAKMANNGITRPADGTETGKVWATADAISAAQGGHACTAAQLKEHKDMAGVNDHTRKTQYSRWRQFNGIKGRIVIIKSAPAEGHYDAALPTNGAH